MKNIFVLLIENLDIKELIDVLIDEKYFCFANRKFGYKRVKTSCINFVSASILLSTFCESQLKIKYELRQKTGLS